VLFNLLYLLPVLGLTLFDYSEGGTTKMADLTISLAEKIACLYVLGVLAFLSGSRLGSAVANSHPIRSWTIHLFKPTGFFRLLCVAMAAMLVLTKWLLVPLGVYSEYAFDTGSTIGGLWSFSMFCSESLLLLSVVVLFSNVRRNVSWFLVLTAVNAINLLHGTRLFFMIAGIAFCLYLYMHGKLTLKIAIFAFCCALTIAYVVFLTRSNVELDEQTSSWARVISPIMFESIFSQLSLIEALKHTELWSSWGSIHNFFLDALYFITPRIILPAKDQLLFIDRFSDLSPLGAFSGYAQGLIYFGYIFPVFYFTLGIVAGWLLRHARNSQLWSMIYVYFVCDFLFRIMRDGYIIPIKMLVNAMGILFLAIWFGRVQALGPLPDQQGLRTSPDAS